jgi:uncharacterized protein (DUF488 family)
MKGKILTIGHSTRSILELIALLQENKVSLLVDVRTIPRSRKNPQFNNDELETALTDAGIGYLHMKGLGGLRHPKKDSPNTGWHNDSFRGYADYMQTTEFESELRKLLELASQKQVAVMCAEAVPWRCHRSLIADVLSVRGILVEHIIGKSGRYPHKMTSFANVEGIKIIYPEPRSSDQ